MAVLNRVQNPFETSFENMTTQVQAGAKKVQKTTSDAIKAVAEDVKEQVMGQEKPKTPEEQAKQQQVAQKSEEDKKQLLAQTRQNLEKINQEILQIRQTREKQYQEKLKAEEKKKQEKKAEEKKKAEDPVWKKMLKTGSHEAMKNVAG